MILNFEYESFDTYMDLMYRDFVVELKRIITKKIFCFEEQYKFIPVVGAVLGWHWLVPQRHWTVLTTIAHAPLPQYEHWYCFGVTIGPSILASSNVWPTGISFKAFTSASYIIVLFVKSIFNIFQD